MEQLKRAVIILTPFASKNDIRRAVSAAELLTPLHREAWAFQLPLQSCQNLPLDKITVLPVKLPPVAALYLPFLETLTKFSPSDIFLFTGGRFASELAASFACHINGSCALSITGLRPLLDGVAAVRAVYDFQATAEIAFHTPPYIFSLAENAFSLNENIGNPEITELSLPVEIPDWFTDCTETFSSEAALKEHDLILIGGRGLGSNESAKSLNHLASLLDAGIGGTRPAVWNGWFSSNHLVGLSGQTIAPKASIVFGSSGSTPFIKGIEDSRFVASVDINPESSIFRQCDLGLVGDCNEIILELIKLSEGKNSK